MSFLNTNPSFCQVFLCACRFIFRLSLHRPYGKLVIRSMQRNLSWIHGRYNEIILVNNCVGSRDLAASKYLFYHTCKLYQYFFWLMPMEFTFIFSVIFGQIFFVKFFEDVGIVRNFHIDAFMDGKVFSVFLVNKGVLLMGTAKVQWGKAIANLEFLIPWLIRIVQCLMSKRNLSGDEVNKPAVLLEKFLN